MKLPQIVLVESDIAFARSFINEFEVNLRAEIHHFLTFEDAYKNVSDIEPEFIVTEYQLCDMQNPKMISDLSLRSPLSKIVVLSNQKDVDIIEQLYDNGAFKYIRKEDFNLNQLKSLFINHSNSKPPSDLLYSQIA